MNIASDKEGEVIAFGTTVPHITPSTSAADIDKHSDFLLRRLIAAINTGHITPDEHGTVVVPAPVVFATGDSLFSIQETALRLALSLTRWSSTHGYTVVSCTPAALTDRPAGADGEAPDAMYVGNVLLIAKHADAAKFADTANQLDVAAAWTGYADQVYGKAAINRVMQEMQQQIIEASNQSMH